CGRLASRGGCLALFGGDLLACDRQRARGPTTGSNPSIAAPQRPAPQSDRPPPRPGDADLCRPVPPGYINLGERLSSARAKVGPVRPRTCRFHQGRSESDGVRRNPPLRDVLPLALPSRSVLPDRIDHSDVFLIIVLKGVRATVPPACSSSSTQFLGPRARSESVMPIPMSGLVHRMNTPSHWGWRWLFLGLLCVTGAARSGDLWPCLIRGDAPGRLAASPGEAPLADEFREPGPAAGASSCTPEPIADASPTATRERTRGEDS